MAVLLLVRIRGFPAGDGASPGTRIRFRPVREQNHFDTLRDRAQHRAGGTGFAFGRAETHEILAPHLPPAGRTEAR